MGVLQVVVLLLYRLNYRSFLVGFRDCYICHPCHICHLWIVAEDSRYPRYSAVLVESFKAKTRCTRIQHRLVCSNSSLYRIEDALLLAAPFLGLFVCSCPCERWEHGLCE